MKFWRRSMFLSLVSIFAGVGCGATMAQLHTRASIDLSCAPENIRVEEIDAATRKATGCGKRALYVELLNNARSPTWLLNSSVEAIDTPTASRSVR